MIVGMLRIKNESRWIVSVLSSLIPCCERIFVMDDHSTDDTVALCHKVAKVTVFESPFEGIQETRDKNWLLEKVAAVKPTWIVHIDGDEEIAAPGQEHIRRLGANTEGGPDSYRFRVRYLWDSHNQVRMDGIYSNFWRGSMFRYRPDVQFRSNSGGGFHCGNTPEPRWLERAPVDILHYGYMHKEDRLRKFDWYNKIDPNNRAEDCYKHMVIGDSFPKDSKFLHAGPLHLESIEVHA